MSKKVKTGEKKKSPRSEKTRGKWKKTLRLWLRLILNWRFLVCFGIGWIITNGWSYILFALGWLFQNEWMLGIASAYLAFLWLPISPEKVVTVAIALFLVRKLFPKHNRELEADILAASGKDGSKNKKKAQAGEQEEQEGETL